MKRRTKFRKISIALTFCLILCIITSVRLYQKVGNRAQVLLPAIIIDPGHGGQDGGAVSPDGISEQDINLSIGKKLRSLSIFCGVSAIMTRSDQQSLNFNPENTLKKNKTQDMVARVQIAKTNPSSDFISIHLNKYDDSKYAGAQVFHRKDQQSLLLAQQLQGAIYGINPLNKRVFKPVPNKNYIMENIQNTAVIVECGFLSNAEETMLLQQDLYQVKLAMLIMGGYTNYKYNR